MAQKPQIQEVYKKYSEKLGKCLPMDDCLFIIELFAHKLLPGDTENQLKALPTQAAKALHFLNYVIKPALDVDDTSSFDNLLSVMEHCSYVHVKNLACEIKSEINKASNIGPVSPPLEFSVGQRMEEAFGRLLEKFLDEFQQPYPRGPSLAKVKLWCITYCAFNELDEADFSDVPSMESLIFKIAKLKYCNFLTLGLLEYLANLSNNECLIVSIRNYNRTFDHAKMRDQVVSDSTMKSIRRSFGFKSKRRYVRVYTKSIGRGMTYGQTKKLRDVLSHRIFHIIPRSTTTLEYGEGSVYLGWQIPSCLVEAAYHAACTNTALFAQLGIQYIIIEHYKIEPPTTCVRETPMELFCRHYQYLVQTLQPVEVTKAMHSEKLLNQKEFTAIMNSPCDHIRNCMIIEHVRHQAMSYLFLFLNVLQGINNQGHIYDTLVNDLSLAGYTMLPENFEIILDDGSENVVWPSSPNKTSFLNMNLSTGSMKRQFLTLPDSKELKDVREFKSLNVNIQYLYIIDTLYKLLESYDPRIFVDKCASLMASDIHNITLFSSKFLQQLSQCSNMLIVLKILMCYSTWCDHSVVKKLLESCECSEGLRLLEQFESQINFTLPITHFPILVPSSFMIPSETSDFAVMTTQCVQERSLLSLGHVRVLKSLINKISDVNDTGCQLLAKKDNPLILFWLVPKSVVSLIGTKVQESYDDLHEVGIIEVAFYPSGTGGSTSMWSSSFLFSDEKRDLDDSDKAVVTLQVDNNAMLKHVSHQRDYYITKFKECATLLDDALKMKDQKIVETQSTSRKDFGDSKLELSWHKTDEKNIAVSEEETRIHKHQDYTEKANTETDQIKMTMRKELEEENQKLHELLHEQTCLKAELKPSPPEPLPRNKKPATSAPSILPKPIAKPQQPSPPKPLPHNKKPATSAPSIPPKPIAKPQQFRQFQDVDAVKYSLSIQGQHDLQNHPFEKLMKQVNIRLSAVEMDVKTIKDAQAVNSVSLEEKLGRAIENIENKLEKLANFIYSQRESENYTNMEAKMNTSRQLQDKDETYIYAACSNEYTEEQFYGSVPEALVQKIKHPHPTPRCEYDYATRHGPVTRYMPLSNTNHDSSDGPYHYTTTIKQPRIQQVKSRLPPSSVNAGLRDILQNLKAEIILTVQLTYLLPFLRQKRLVTETEFHQLASDGQESEPERNEMLIRIIMTKGEDAFDLFVEALQEEQEHLGHNSLAKRLLHEQRWLKAEMKSAPPIPRESIDEPQQ